MAKRVKCLVRKAEMGGIEANDSARGVLVVQKAPMIKRAA